MADQTILQQVPLPTVPTASPLSFHHQHQAQPQTPPPQTPIDSSTHTALLIAKATGTLLYRTIVYPLWFLLYHLTYLILRILHLLYKPIAFLLQPVVYLANFLLGCIVAPFILLAKLETVYIYLSIAALVGLAIGYAGFALSSSLQSALGLREDDFSSSSRSSSSKRSARKTQQGNGSTRQRVTQQQKRSFQTTSTTQQQRKGQEQILLPSPLASPGLTFSSGGSGGGGGGAAGRGRKGGLLDQTILEEGDSDY